ncbi:MAG: GIY-YIG nuclease family protein [Methanobrevibacter sp.]|uniref:GIY-YIG nuclease family protein n=1 Tax=Methanobrevibacter sp. TaxID=66852 RepID=UPI001B727DFA|nr:GIY-YIG nuclease family protein [Methanobrevibacter sp.]MBP3791220.1 GIY-YIG nuclease family protein [Methanobrevibacter sp.]
MKGCYCLIIKLDHTCEIKIGKRLGKLKFEDGHYVYVGSALNSLTARLNRHISNEKKMHWHVDYLLKKSEITDIIYNESTKKIECNLSQYLSQNSKGVKNFGCSDCDCESHLYYFKNRSEAIEQVQNAYDSIAMEYKFFKI